MALLKRKSQHPEVVGAMRPSMWHMMADAEARVTSSWVSCEALARSGSQRHFFVDSVSRVAQKGLGRGRTGDPSAWVAVSMAWFSCSHMTLEALLPSARRHLACWHQSTKAAEEDALASAVDC